MMLNRRKIIQIGSAFIALHLGQNNAIAMLLEHRRTYFRTSADATRGVFGSGDTGVKVNVIDYFTISTPGNAIDFGDLTVAKSEIGALSDA